MSSPEIGHNLSLGHSGALDASGIFDEYFDTSGYMGYHVVDVPDFNNAKKCYNAAKMYDLGWYDDRVTTIAPDVGKIYQWKIIGVNDYSIADPSFTLVLEIKDPNAKEADPYFLTYNK